MSTDHRGGNVLNTLALEEHDGDLNAKRVVVAGGSLGGGQATVSILGNVTTTISNSLVTVTLGTKIDSANDSITAVFGNVTLSDAKTYIGLTTTTLGASPSFVGIVTVTNKDRTITGNVTLSDARTFIGLVTVGGGPVNILGNVTLSDSKTFIGLTTTTLGASPAFIGLVSISGFTNPLPVSVVGNLTLSDSRGYIGLVTVGGGLSRVNVLGNLTLSDSRGFLGLVTAVPAYGSGSTVYTGVISATGNTTVVVAPASNRFFIKNLHISSLGRSEVEIRSGATTLIPFTSLSTTAGYFEHYGEMGLPARAQTDALVINLNGGATISYMANVRFEA